ncbi:hypothetical protein [Stenomitos frigidus]|uniref:Uncharacterized protein n=1 Tax=Stenomitos frigidus ULC18 TaxID=2107698 RepID=A0A2T1DZT8_9CYAN|nr:hypothetical protein [Stenomitos frigidus]PSB26003.1 hypothetical protein C7B82_21115 [Stenomitos frigidus ULC18]
MAKTPLQFRDAESLQTFHRARRASFFPGASLLMAIAVLAAWMPAASARPYIQVQSVPVQGNGYGTQRQVINFPAVVPFNNSIYSPVQTTIHPGFGGGLSVQIGTPNVYPSGVYQSGYSYGQPHVIQRRGINNSVLVNPTVINSPIRNSTLINPTIVTTPLGSYYSTPYYPSPYYNTQTITTTTRPEPEVYIDPQYGVRYRSPAVRSEQQIIIYPR